MWLVSRPGAVPLTQRIALTCRTDVLRLEVSSKARVAPPSYVDLKVKDIEREGRAVLRFVARQLALSAKPIEAHPTYRRISRLIGQAPIATVSSKWHNEVLSVFEKVRSTGIRGLKRHRSAEAVIAMIEQARVSGITPLEPELRIDCQRPDSPRGGDTNIGVAILDGEAYFYRRGHHRLAIAKALGIPEVPVDILLWDSEFNNLHKSARINLLAALGIHQSPSA